MPYETALALYRPNSTPTVLQGLPKTQSTSQGIPSSGTASGAANPHDRVNEASYGIFFRVVAAGMSLFATGKILDYFSRDQNYNDVVSLITKEVNHATNSRAYTEKRVQMILNVYINAVLENESLPEYDARTKETIDRCAEMIAVVTRAAGEQDEKTVRLVLGQLYWSTAQGRVHDTAFIRPRTARNYAKERAKPAPYKNEKTFSEQFSDMLGTLGTVVIAGAVVYMGVMIYNETKE